MTGSSRKRGREPERESQENGGDEIAEPKKASSSKRKTSRSKHHSDDQRQCEKHVDGIGEITWMNKHCGKIRMRHSDKIFFFTDYITGKYVTPGYSLFRFFEEGLWIHFKSKHVSDTVYNVTEILPISESMGFDITPVIRNGYRYDLEAEACNAIIDVFVRNNAAHIKLSSLHPETANYSSRELAEYVGLTNSYRRNFLRQRRHLFNYDNDQKITLRSQKYYDALRFLANKTHGNGGVISTKHLYQCYLNDVHDDAASFIGNEDKYVGFLDLLFDCYGFFYNSRDLEVTTVYGPIPDLSYRKYLPES